MSGPYDPRYDEESVRVLEAAERCLLCVCDCPGADNEHTPECRSSVYVACAMAEEDILAIWARHRRELEGWIERKKLEARIEKLEGDHA